MRLIARTGSDKLLKRNENEKSGPRAVSGEARQPTLRLADAREDPARTAKEDRRIKRPRITHGAAVPRRAPKGASMRTLHAVLLSFGAMASAAEPAAALEIFYTDTLGGAYI